MTAVRTLPLVIHRTVFRSSAHQKRNCSLNWAHISSQLAEGCHHFYPVNCWEKRSAAFKSFLVSQQQQQTHLWLGNKHWFSGNSFPNCESTDPTHLFFSAGNYEQFMLEGDFYSYCICKCCICNFDWKFMWSSEFMYYLQTDLQAKHLKITTDIHMSATAEDSVIKSHYEWMVSSKFSNWTELLLSSFFMSCSNAKLEVLM